MPMLLFLSKIVLQVKIGGDGSRRCEVREDFSRKAPPSPQKVRLALIHFGS